MTRLPFLNGGSSVCDVNLHISGNGYVRSEAIVTILLMKSSEAKRVYASVVHSKSNTDGFKEQGNRDVPLVFCSLDTLVTPVSNFTTYPVVVVVYF